jgi:hypothetical protein
MARLRSFALLIIGLCSACARAAPTVVPEPAAVPPAAEQDDPAAEEVAVEEITFGEEIADGPADAAVVAQPVRPPMPSMMESVRMDPS